MYKFNKLTEQQKIEFSNLYNIYNADRLAEIYNTNRATVYNWGKKLNLTSNRQEVKIKNFNKEEFVKLYNSKTIKELCTHYGVGKSNIIYHAKKLNCFIPCESYTKPFTDEEVLKFKQLAKITPTIELENIFSRTRSVICRARNRYNCHFDSDSKKLRSYQLSKNKFTEKLGGERNLQIFLELFPWIGNNDLMELFGISEKTIYSTVQFFKCSRDDNFQKLYQEHVGLLKRTSEEIQIYLNEANWKKQMFDFLESDINFLTFKKLGVYNNKTNKTGLVRDHIYSRREGYKNRIFPELLRHPANCQLLTLTQNSIKSSNSHISLDDLFDKIVNYSKNWHEQKVCLKLIQDYKNGMRWICRGGKRQDEIFKENYSTKMNV